MYPYVSLVRCVLVGEKPNALGAWSCQGERPRPTTLVGSNEKFTMHCNTQELGPGVSVAAIQSI